MGCTIHVVCTLHGFMLYLLVYSVLGFAVTFPSSHLFDFSQKQECVALTHKKKSGNVSVFAKDPKKPQQIATPLCSET